LAGVTHSIGGVASVLPGASTALSNVDAAGRPFDPNALSFDPQGRKIVRGEVLAVEPTDRDIAAARHLNFAVKQRETLKTLGFDAVTLLAPTNVDAISALAALRAADPAGKFDFDHIYDPSGSTAHGSASASHAASAMPVAKTVAVGMIDGGIDVTHPAFAGSTVVATSVTGAASYEPTVHGTAVASLLVGNDRNFHGELPGAALFAADAFGGSATGGSALDIARALDWLAKNHVAVANASLAGPPNVLLEAAVKAFLAKGHVLVAAAGNQGPAAPPAYPAAYPGVIGVTSVDDRRHLQYDANRGDVAFAAKGVGVRAASLNRSYDVYTGTSFAAPVVAAHFALLLPSPDAVAAEEARANLARQAQALGDHAAYGYGYVAPVALNAPTQ
jgi:subtilisin family serine protease